MTHSALGTYCRTQRLAKGLTLGQLAKLLGYTNIGKGARRAHELETTGKAPGDLLVKIMGVLNLDPAIVGQPAAEDHEEFLRQWNEWADVPIRRYLVAKVIPGIYRRVELPGDVLTPDAAEAFATGYARDHGYPVCLVVTRRMSVWFSSDGSVITRTETRPGEVNEPYVTLRR